MSRGLGWSLLFYVRLLWWNISPLTSNEERNISFPEKSNSVTSRHRELNNKIMRDHEHKQNLGLSKKNKTYTKYPKNGKLVLNLSCQKIIHVNQTRKNHKFKGVSHKLPRKHKCTGKQSPAGRDSDFIIFVSFEDSCHHSDSRNTTSDLKSVSLTLIAVALNKNRKLKMLLLRNNHEAH